MSELDTLKLKLGLLNDAVRHMEYRLQRVEEQLPKVLSDEEHDSIMNDVYASGS